MLEEAFSYVFTGIIFLYCVHFLKYGVALALVREDQDKLISENYIKVSVIVPVRNEIGFLESIFKDLKNQSYPQDYFEVLFIDDHSTDGSGDFLTNLCAEHKNFKLLFLEDHLSGKKHAIEKGVKKATGKWIIQTDADCKIPENFILCHASKAMQKEMTVVAGPVVLLEKPGLWNKIESLEFMSLAGTGIASFLTGKPVMCNGANLSYSKNFYMEVRANLMNSPSASGDDIFLMTEAKKLKREMTFIYSSNSVVSAEPAGSFKTFINQRMRWGSKSRFYKDANLIYLTLLVWLVNFFLVLALIASLFYTGFFYLFISFLGMKALVDFLILYPSAKFFRRKSLLWFFPPTVIFYYFYITFTGVFSIFGSFNWKGRTYT